MAYFNHVNNAAFYSAPAAPGQFDAFPFLGQMSANEEDNILQTYNQFAGGWSMGEQPDYMVGGPSNFPAEADFGKDNFGPLARRCLTRGSPASLPSVASYPAQDFGYGQPPYPGNFWPANAQYVQPHRPDVVNWDDSFSNVVALGAPMVHPTPGSGKCSFPLNP